MALRHRPDNWKEPQFLMKGLVEETWTRNPRSRTMQECLNQLQMFVSSNSIYLPLQGWKQLRTGKDQPTLWNYQLYITLFCLFLFFFPSSWIFQEICFPPYRHGNFHDRPWQSGHVRQNWVRSMGCQKDWGALRSSQNPPILMMGPWNPAITSLRFIGSLSRYLYGFIHPRWLFKISAINSSSHLSFKVFFHFRGYGRKGKPWGWVRAFVHDSCGEIFWGIFSMLASRWAWADTLPPQTCAEGNAWAACCFLSKDSQGQRDLIGLDMESYGKVRILFPWVLKQFGHVHSKTIWTFAMEKRIRKAGVTLPSNINLVWRALKNDLSQSQRSHDFRCQWLLLGQKPRDGDSLLHLQGNYQNMNSCDYNVVALANSARSQELQTLQIRFSLQITAWSLSQCTCAS